MKFSKKNIISLINTSDNFQGELIEDDQKHWKALIEGDYKDMAKTEVGFSNKQLEQLEVLITRVVEQVVPPMIDQKLNPFKKEVCERLDRIEKDIEAMKNTPTMKKELNQSNK